MGRWRILYLDRDSPVQTEAQGCSPALGQTGHHILVLFLSLVLLLSWSTSNPSSPSPLQPWGDLCPFPRGSPQYSHGRTYWDRRKPSWGGAGPRAGRGKPRISSLLPLSPPRRTEEPGGLWHCPSCPPGPQSWAVCCSRRAAQKGANGERDLSKSIPETALNKNLARKGSGKGVRTWEILGCFWGLDSGPSLRPQEGTSMNEGRGESP